MTRLRIVPVARETAKQFVLAYHRHSVPPLSHKFSLGLADDEGRLAAVAIAGRPVARGLDPYSTIEITRVCSLGARNACSALYGACVRAAEAMGYLLVVTYSRDDEDGASLKAAGFARVADVLARSWDTPSRPRTDRDERVDRGRWERMLRPRFISVEGDVEYAVFKGDMQLPLFEGMNA